MSNVVLVDDAAMCDSYMPQFRRILHPLGKKFYPQKGGAWERGD